MQEWFLIAMIICVQIHQYKRIKSLDEHLTVALDAIWKRLINNEVDMDL